MLKGGLSQQSEERCSILQSVPSGRKVKNIGEEKKPEVLLQDLNFLLEIDYDDLLTEMVNRRRLHRLFLVWFSFTQMCIKRKKMKKKSRGLKKKPLLPLSSSSAELLKQAETVSSPRMKKLIDHHQQSPSKVQLLRKQISTPGGKKKSENLVKRNIGNLIVEGVEDSPATKLPSPLSLQQSLPTSNSDDDSYFFGTPSPPTTTTTHDHRTLIIQSRNVVVPKSPPMERRKSWIEKGKEMMKLVLPPSSESVRTTS